MVVEKRLVVHDASDGGAGADAEAYANKVEQAFGHSFDDRLSGPQAARRHKASFARRKLLNGHGSNFHNPEHVCRLNRGCCLNREHTLQQLNDEVFEQIARPGSWAANRWLGCEDAMDFVGLWVNTHALYLV